MELAVGGGEGKGGAYGVGYGGGGGGTPIGLQVLYIFRVGASFPCAVLIVSSEVEGDDVGRE